MSETDSELECVFYKTNTLYIYISIGSISLIPVNVFYINECVELVYNENVLCSWVYILDMHCSMVYGINGLNYNLLTLFKWNPAKTVKSQGQAIWIDKW